MAHTSNMRFSRIRFTHFIIQVLFCIAYTINANAQGRLMLSEAQALEDFKWLRFSLEYVHPRLYKYEDKRAVDARFDSLGGLIGNQISGLDFLALVSRANAAVQCGHLYTIPQSQLAQEVLNKRVLSFQIKVLDKKLYAINDCSIAPIPNGSQILSINGRSSDEIFSAVLPGIATDGNISTRKYRLMERYFYNLFHGFDLYYHLHVDRSETFKISYLTHGSAKSKTVIVKGMRMDERTKLLKDKCNVDEQAWFKSPSPQFEVHEANGYAILELSRSFYDKNIDPSFDSLVQAAFRLIKEKKIQNLILDLRNNEGGSEYQQMELMSYLYDQPFKLYQNIFLSNLDFRPLKSVIIERDTAALLFDNSDEYMRKINENLWINNYEYDNSLKLKPPKVDVFEGKLYVLMNGISFSSTADLISDIKKTRNAIFIGEESGGTFEGPTGGDNIVIQLPNSKIMVRISPNVQIGHMYQKHPIGRGVLPDYPIKYTIQDVLNGRDLEMEKAKSLIGGIK
jgi:hypothetical protein